MMFVYLGLGYLRVREYRQSGITQSFGHPLVDSFLLLISGLLVAAALMFFMVEFRNGGSHFLAYVLLLGFGGTLTWVCNGVLRGSRGQ
jgi:F0F1-type ATP synthase assembly protein I